MKKTKQTEQLPKIRILQNKKGQTQIQIIHPKTKKRTTYTYQNNMPIDVYYQHWKTKQKTKKKTNIKQYYKAYTNQQVEPKYDKIKKQATQYYTKHKTRYPVIETKIRKGITKALINDIHQADNTTIRKTYETLMRPLILDNTLLKILCTDENMEKIKHRLEYKATIGGTSTYTGQTTTIGQLNHIGQKNIRTILQELQQEIPTNKEIKDTQLNYTLKTLKNKGYQYQHYNNGKAKKTNLLIIFRKA